MMYDDQRYEICVGKNSLEIHGHEMPISEAILLLELFEAAGYNMLDKGSENSMICLRNADLECEQKEMQERINKENEGEYERKYKEQKDEIACFKRIVSQHEAMLQCQRDLNKEIESKLKEKEMDYFKLQTQVRLLEYQNSELRKELQGEIL